MPIRAGGLTMTKGGTVVARTTTVRRRAFTREFTSSHSRGEGARAKRKSRARHSRIVKGEREFTTTSDSCQQKLYDTWLMVVSDKGGSKYRLILTNSLTLTDLVSVIVSNVRPSGVSSIECSRLMTISTAITCLQVIDATQNLDRCKSWHRRQLCIYLCPPVGYRS